MICSDIWHKYHKWYFEIVRSNYCWNLREFWNITSGTYVIYHVQIVLLFVYTTTHKSFVIFTWRYFKLSWNTTALSQSNRRNFSCSSIIWEISFWNERLHSRSSTLSDLKPILFEFLFIMSLVKEYGVLLSVLWHLQSQGNKWGNDVIMYIYF